MKTKLLFALCILCFRYSTFAWNTPSHSSPTNGSNSKAGVTIDWNAVSGSQAYQYQYDTVPGFNSPILGQGTKSYINSSSGNSDTQQSLSDLYYGKTYYWRVRAYVSGDTSAWSTAWTFNTPVYGPSHFSPSNGAINVKAGATLDWDSHYYVLGYDWQLDTVPTFNSSVLRQGSTNYVNTSNGNSDTQVTLGGFYYGKTHYWRVRSRNTVDTSQWTIAWNFTVVQTGPVHYSPSNGAVNVKAGATLDWDSHYYVLGYDWQLDTVSSFNSPALRTGSTSYVNTSNGNSDTQVTLGDFYYGKNYFWRVRSRNSVDTSQWTTAWTFNAVSTGPVHYSPSNGAVNVKAGATLDWDSHYYVLGYDWQLDTVSSFNSPALRTGSTSYVNTSNGNSDTQVTLGDFYYGKNYFWRVRSRNQLDTSQWTTAWTFNTVSTGPVHYSPSNGAVNVKAGATLDWDSHYYVLGYDWQVDTVPTFNSSVLRQGSTNYVNTSNGNSDTQVTLGDFYYGKTHYWRVRSRNQLDTSQWTTAWSFNVVLTGPTLLSPNNGQLNVSTTSATLDWDSHYYIVKYQLQVDTHNLFNTPFLISADKTYINTSNGNSDTRHTLTSLPANTVYFWRVRSINNVDTSDWTTTWNFSTGNNPFLNPTPPVLVSPADGSTTTATSALLDWNSVSNILYYDYEVDTVSSFNSGWLITGTHNYISSSNTNSDTEYNLTGLQAGKTYYWRVRTRTSNAASAWSSIWSFSVVCGTQATVSPSGPVNLCPGDSVQLTAGTANSYNWSTGETTQSIFVYSSGNYYVNSTDGVGCTSSSNTVTVNTANIEQAVITLAGPTSFCQGGSVYLSVNSGPGYLWSTGNTTPAVIANSSGNYFVEVTDTNGCKSFSDTIIVTVNANPTVLVNSTDQTYVGQNNGTVSANPSGGAAPYEYYWTNGETTQNYSVTVTDTLGCFVTASATINAVDCSNLSLTVSKTDESGPSANNGTAVAILSGGISPYSYSWTNSATSDSVSGLAPGNYSVIVTDNKGCTLTGSVTIASFSCNLSVSVSTTSETSPNGNNGTATANLTGGSGPYLYQWSNSATSASISGLAPGTYCVTVSDTNNCTVNSCNSVAPFNCTLSATISSTNETQAGANDGTATANAINGTSPYTYAWSNSATTVSVSGLTPGNYSVTITDANGCTANSSVIIQQGTCGLQISSTFTQPSCNGGNNGVATVTASSGVPPYTYLWNTGATTSTISGIIAGTYNVTVTDSVNCQKLLTVTVTQPAALLLSVTKTDESCASCNNGTATASVSGGTSPYTYLWSNSATTVSVSGLAPGNYFVTVTDNKGCTKTASVAINAVVCNLSASVTTTDETFPGSLDGTATANVSGGTQPYSYVWSNGETDDMIVYLSAGTYSVTITDSQGCTATATGIVNGQPCTLTATVNGSNETFAGANDGTALVTAANGTPPYSYSWSNGATTAGIINLPPGTYSVTVTDFGGCQTTGSYSVLPGTVGILSFSDINDMSIYPNPATDFVNLKFNATSESVISIHVFDIAGKRIFNTINKNNIGENIVKIPLEELPSGFYTILIEENGKKHQLLLGIVK
jgi:hypothetical protein